MILADTSVWLEALRIRGTPIPGGRLLGLATCGPVIQEVLRGLRERPDTQRFRQSFLSLPMLSDPIPAALYIAAAEIYRSGRARGLTIRSSADCLVAAIAIENRVPVWHRDRDYVSIARFTPLRAVSWD